MTSESIFFSYRTVNCWISLPSEIVEALSENLLIPLREDWISFVGSLTGCLQAVAVLTSRPMKRVKFTLRLHHTNSPTLHDELW